MALYLVRYLLPALMVLFALPMVLGKIPPNPIYGFRTPKTLSSPDIWYPANRIAGWFMVAAGALVFCFNLLLWKIHPDWPLEILGIWMGGVSFAAVLLAPVASLIYLRRL